MDKRTDIWAFGCVLYEMLTGKRAFEGRDVSETIAFVITKDVDWHAVPTGTPPFLRRLLRRCLEREPKRRLRDVGDARFDLEEGAEPSQAPEVHVAEGSHWWSPPTVAMAALGVVVGLAAATVWWSSRSGVPSTGAQRTEIVLPAGTRLQSDSSFDVSDDGRRLVFVGRRDDDGQRQVYVRDLERLTSDPVAGTERARRVVFSPNGEEIAFVTEPVTGGGSRLHRVRLDGSPPFDLGLGSQARWAGLAWGEDDTFVLGGGQDGLIRINGSTGEATALTTVNVDARERFHESPAFLPGGSELLFTVTLEDASRHSEVVRAADGQRTVIEGSGGLARYLSSGHLLYVKRDAIMVAPFDLRRLSITGTETPLPIPIDMSREISSLPLDVSGTGTLFHVPPESDIAGEMVLSMLDSDGVETSMVQLPDEYDQPRVSPDGRHVVGSTRNHEIWLYAVEDVRPPVRLASSSDYRWPVWSPDGDSVAFAELLAGSTNLVSMRRDAPGSAPTVLRSVSRSVGLIVPSSWSREGEILYTSIDTSGQTTSMWAVESAGQAEPRRIVGLDTSETQPAISPSGDRLAFVSRQSGKQEVWLTPYPFAESGRPVQVSLAGGFNPRWSRDGRELYFLEGDRLMSVEIESDPAVLPPEPRPLFERPPLLTRNQSPGGSYDVLPGGHFLFLRDGVVGPGLRRIVVVQNWFDELQRLVPSP